MRHLSNSKPRTWNLFRFSCGVLASLLLFLASAFFEFKTVSAESVIVELNVHVCNNNNICEAVIGENYGSCPSDCPPPVTPTSTPTTTPPTNPGPVTSPGVGYTAAPSENFAKGIDGQIKIAPYQDRVIITFNTHLPVLASISWGETASYELGSSASAEYRQKHVLEISNLKPGTLYYFKIKMLDTLGREVEYESFFRTIKLPDFTTLPVAQNLQAQRIAGTNSVQLTWSAADLAEGQRLRLTRSDKNFPIDPFEGRVVYEGRGNQVVDAGLQYDTPYFYALFVVDGEGKYSAPAIVRVKITKETEGEGIGEGVKDPDQFEDYDPLIDDPTPVYVEMGGNADRLAFCGDRQTVLPILSHGDSYIDPENRIDENQVSFFQDGKKVLAVNGIVRAQYQFPLVMKVSKSIAQDDRDRIGICLVSKVTGFESYYLFTKNSDGDFELVFPHILNETVEKKHYQFTLGMIKFMGQEEVIGKGEIMYVLKYEDTADILENFAKFILPFLILGISLWIILRKKSRKEKA